MISLSFSCKTRKTASLKDGNMTKANFVEVIKLTTLDWTNIAITAEVEKLKAGELDSKSIPGGLKIYFRMKKDEIIWASVRSALLGMEVARVKVTPDSIYIINKAEKTVSTYPVNVIQKIIPGISGISELQKILLGQNLFEPKTYSWVNSNSVDSFYLFHKDDYLKNSLSGIRKSALVSESLISDVKGTFDGKILYSNYKTVSKHPVPYTVDISAKSGKDNVKILINYEKVEQKEDLTFPFTIPASYEKL